MHILRLCQRLPMIQSAFSLFVLRELPFSRFDFPRWQALLAVSMIGVLVGLDPGFRAPPSGAPAAPMWAGVLIGLASTWVAFLVIVGVLRWWLKRGARWDGQGDLFNLVAASWLVADTLGAGLTALGIPPLLTLPLWLYSVWVGAQAMESAMPRVTLGYAVGGIAIGLIPAMLASGLAFGLLAAVLGLLDLSGTAPGAGA